MPTALTQIPQPQPRRRHRSPRPQPDSPANTRAPDPGGSRRSTAPAPLGSPRSVRRRRRDGAHRPRRGRQNGGGRQADPRPGRAGGKAPRNPRGRPGGFSSEHQPSPGHRPEPGGGRERGPARGSDSPEAAAAASAALSRHSGSQAPMAGCERGRGACCREGRRRRAGDGRPAASRQVPGPRLAPAPPPNFPADKAPRLRSPPAAPRSPAPGGERRGVSRHERPGAGLSLGAASAPGPAGAQLCCSGTARGERAARPRVEAREGSRGGRNAPRGAAGRLVRGAGHGGKLRGGSGRAPQGSASLPAQLGTRAKRLPSAQLRTQRASREEYIIKGQQEAQTERPELDES